MPKQLAKWNPAQDAWVTETGGLFCEHSDVYSETLPKQGMTRNGILYELPTSVPHTEGSGYSSPRGQGKPANQDWEDVPLLMTPMAAEAEKAVSGQSVAHREGGGHQAWLTNQVMDLHRKNEELLPTPAVNDMGAAYTPETWDAWTARMKAAHGNGNGHGKSPHIEALRMLPTPNTANNENRQSEGYGPNLGEALRVLPTPQARDYKGVPGDGFNNASLPREVALLPTPVAQPSGNTPTDHLRKKPGRNQITDLAIIAENGLFETGGKLLPTPTSERPDGRKSDAFREGRVNFFDVVEQNQWGEYAAAMSRWEALFWGPAPDPTLPTGRDGKHQLSAAFVEWLMGLPPGHVTDTPIPRNAQLKALGNGVVPAQAAEAIRRALT